MKGNDAPPDRYTVAPFRPAWWLPGAHAQTVAGRFLRAVASDPGLRRERLELPDGDFLDLDHAPEPAGGAGRGAPLVVLLHGLEGSARRGYALLTYRALNAAGIRAVGLNFRGCGGEPNRRARAYHSGETDDLRFVLEYLADRNPGTPMGAIGFSLGGNVLLKYLGEEGEGARDRLRAAVAVSVPFDLEAGSRQLEQGFGRVYTWYFVRSLRRKIERKAAALGPRIDWEAALRARNFRAFDDAVTAPLHGFADATDYYRRASSAGFLPAIRVSTLLLQSVDDPFLPPGAIPRDAIASNPWLIDGFTSRGGHVGSIAGAAPWAPEFWIERQASAFLARMLEAREHDGVEAVPAD